MLINMARQSSHMARHSHISGGRSSHMVAAPSGFTTRRTHRKEKKVALPSEHEAELRRVFEYIDVDGDRQIETNELIKACLESSEIAVFFGLEPKDLTVEDVREFFESIDEDNSKGLSYSEMKGWYHKVLRHVQGKKLAATLPPDPSWIAVGGQRLSEKSLRRISNDDLQEAALRGDVGLVRRLIEAGASVNAPLQPFCEDEIMTLLHVLACKPEMPNGTRIIAEILHRTADVDARSSLGTSPLMFACMHKHIGAAEVLLNHDADVDCVDDHGYSALRYCILPRGMSDDGDSENTDKKAMYDEDWENTTVEFIELLHIWGADLDNGGVVHPVTQAVLSDNEVVLGALLGQGAKPHGLHEAVLSCSVATIKALCEAEANPFLKNKTGSTVMELAMQRGNQEIQEIIRDYIGKLEREQHHHLKTIVLDVASGKADGKDAQRRPQSQVKDESPDRLSLFYRRVRRIALHIVKNKYYTSLMLLVLAVALFLPDMFVVFQSTSVWVLDWFLVTIGTLFFFEWFFQVVGLGKKYVGKFFFWCDLVGILSVPLDHSFFQDLLANQTQGLDNSMLVRTTRLARLGARAGRFTKLMKLLKFLPGMGNNVDQLSRNTAKVLSTKINGVLSSQVTCLIIALFIILPIFDFWRYPTEDFSTQAWASMLDDTVKNFPENVKELLQEIEDFYGSLSIFPYEVYLTYTNGTNETIRLSADAPVRLQQDSVKFSKGSTVLVFNFSGPYKLESVLNIVVIVLIAVLTTSAALIVSHAVHALVLGPLEGLFGFVQSLAARIFTGVSSVAKKMARTDENKDKRRSDMEEEEQQCNEIILLEKILRKLSSLVEIALRKKNSNAEGWKHMSAEDKALIIGLCGHDPSTKDSIELLEHEDEDEEAYKSGMLKLKKVATQHLQENEITWDQMKDWDYNLVSITERQRHAVCFGILMSYTVAYEGGYVRTASETSNSKESGVEFDPSTQGAGSGGVMKWADLYNEFISVVRSFYKPVIEVPYHNWIHGVDVLYTLYRIFRTCNAETYLHPDERIALLVCALCHDIGHPGRNNIFLMESHNEIALRYNDSSPLEHMHASKLFEIVGQEKTAIFGHLSRERFKEVRYICIEAILYTDNTKHFGVVSELQMCCEENKAVFDVAFDAALDATRNKHHDWLSYSRAFEKQSRGSMSKSSPNTPQGTSSRQTLGLPGEQDTRSSQRSTTNITTVSPNTDDDNRTSNEDDLVWPSKEVIEVLKAPDTRKLLRTFYLHLCDVSNPMKPWTLCRNWADLIVQEFFMQGDVEKQLDIPVQPLNDRLKVNLAYSQIGFVEFFVAPLIAEVTTIFPPLVFCEMILMENLQRWFVEWVDSSASDHHPDDAEQEKMMERLSKVREKAKIKKLEPVSKTASVAPPMAATASSRSNRRNMRRSSNAK